MRVCPKCFICYDDSDIMCPTDNEYLETSWPASRLIANKYLLKSMFAKGGMGVIYRSIQTELNREVAVKILSPQLLSNERILKQFRREALAVARLDHINIVPVYDYGTLPDNFGAYLVMRLVQGKPLSEEIEDIGALPLERALRIMQQICAGVSAAHAQKVIHCDLKPDNILIENCDTPRERVQLVDFGIAKLKELTIDGTANSAITDSAIGTPQYMSPEQCCGEPLTIHTDIYSLGIIFFEMITGRVPFNSFVAVDVAQHHVRTPPPPPSRFQFGLPTALDYAVLRALAKRPSGRPDSAEQFFEELLSASGITLQPINTELSVTASASTGLITTAYNVSSSNIIENKLDSVFDIPTFDIPKANMPLVTSPDKIESLENIKDKHTRSAKNITAQVGDNKTNPFVNLKTESKALQNEYFFPELMILSISSNADTTIEEILQAFGCTVISTNSTEEAWECLEKYYFNLVITEVLAPKINGWQLFAASQDLAEIPVFIFITNKPNNKDCLQALEQGVEDYWGGPLSFAELQIKLRRLLQRMSKDIQS